MKSTHRLPDFLRMQAVDWLLRMHSENCSAADRCAFKTWLAENPRHRHAYDVIEKQWKWMEPFKRMQFPARDAALHYRSKPRKRQFAYGVAATLLLAFGLTAFSSGGWIGVPQTYTAEKGDRRTITLADGSNLELNTESEVRVHFNHWRRTVELIKGEAFFTVCHDAERPFEVRAGSGRIRDIGTAFEVYHQPGQVVVAVQEGRVEIQALSKRELTAGQQLAFNDKGEFREVHDQDIAALTAWRQGRLVFRNRRLDDVLSEVSRYHNTRIRLGNESLGRLRISGAFHTDRLDDVLHAITDILPVRILHDGNREIVLESAGSSSHNG